MSLTQFDQYIPALNAVIRHNCDPLLGAILRAVSGAENCAAGGGSTYRILQILVFAVGSAFLASTCGRERLVQILAGVFAVLLLCVGAGFDTLALSVAWFPWLLATCLQLVRTDSISHRAAALMATGLWVVSSGIFSVLGLLLVAGVCLVRSASTRSVSSYLTGRGTGTLRGVVFVLLVGFFGALLLMPEYSMPAYPPGARLVSEERVEFAHQPLYGPSLGLQTILMRGFVEWLPRYQLGLLLVGAVLFALPLFELGKRVDGKSFYSFVRVVLPQLALYAVAAMLLFAEPVIIAANPQYSVLSFLASLLPGLALFPVPWVVLPVLLSLLICLTIERASVRSMTAGVGIGLLCVLGLLFSNHWLAPAATFAAVSTSSPEHRLSVSGHALAHTQAAFSRVGRTAPWVENASEWRAYNARLKRIFPTPAEPWKASATVAPADAARMVDGLEHSIWSSIRGQLPGDAISIALTTPRRVSRLVLVTKRSRGKYPHSFNVSYRDADGAEHLLLEHRPWSGPLRYSDSGYAYFGPRDHVIIDFPEQVFAKSLTVTQLERDPNRPWGIDEIRLFELSPSS